MTAREEILATIRIALGVDAADPAASRSIIPRTYNRTSALSPSATGHLFIDRLLDYDTEILEVQSSTDIPAAIANALSNANEAQALIADSFPPSWLPTGGPTFVSDTNLVSSAIEGIPAVITTCEAAVASTGTIILVHQAAQGRRILSLLPDHHICIVHRDQVYETLPQALSAIAPHAHKPLTAISGPSATSDIEMTRIRGVHGPRRLTVILYS